jgi:hypothetical protein
MNSKRSEKQSRIVKKFYLAGKHPVQLLDKIENKIIIIIITLYKIRL